MMDGRSHSRARSCSRASSLPYLDDERMKIIMSERHMVRSWLRMSSQLAGIRQSTTTNKPCSGHSAQRPQARETIYYS